MKTILIFLFFFGLVTNLNAMNKKPKPLNIRDISFPDYQIKYLSNSLKVIIIKNKKQPYIYFKMITGGGSSFEEQNGIAELTSNMLLKGTKNYNQEEFSEKMDLIGSSLYFITNPDYNWVYGSVLRKYLDDFLSVYSDIYINPLFDEKEFEKIKTRYRTKIKAFKSNPDVLSENLLKYSLYGKDHNYSGVLTETLLDSIDIEDIRNYFNTFFLPNNSTLAVIGDVDEDILLEKLEEYFGKWKKQNLSDNLIKTPKPHKGKYFFIERDSSQQTNIKIAAFTTDYNSSDRIKLLITSRYLGSSFSGVLFKNLREKHGYSYNPSVSIQGQKKYIPFIFNADINSDSVINAIEIVHNELDNLTNNQIDSKNLELVKEHFIGNMFTNFEDPFSIINVIQTYEFMKQEKFDIYKLINEVKNITTDDIQQISQKYLLPDNRKTIIVSDSNIKNKITQKYTTYIFDKDYNEIGRNRLNYNIDGITPDTVINNYISAIGGQENIDNIKTLTTHSETEINQNNEVFKGKLIRKQKQNKYMYQSLSFGLINQQIWVNPDKVNLSFQNGNIIEPDTIQTAEYRRQAKILSVSQLTDDFEDIEGFEKKDNYLIISVTNNGMNYSYYFDNETNYLDKLIIRNEKENISIKYSDYKSFGTIKLPVLEIVNSDDITIKLEHQYFINNDINDSAFIPN
jgi:zinc protease